jgi:8-oxo-dGTP pyrophosphatase MutT (NUDIX family)
MIDRLRASAVCEVEGHLLVVRLREPVTGVEAIYPPGGGVEPGEDPAETARRETLEETGLHVRIDPRVLVIGTNPFRWDGIDYQATTHFFAASLEDPFSLTIPKVVDIHYNLGAFWVPLEEALLSMSVYPVIASSVSKVLELKARAR